MLQELEEFAYATSLDLNIGYYTIRLDPGAHHLFTIVTPFESDIQLGAVIAQDKKPIALYNRKLNCAQQRYTTGEQ
jgi:hypothetical protein